MNRLPIQPPKVSPPAPYAERRLRSRRDSDRAIHEETRLLARALDVLAADRPPEARLASLLDLLANTVRAERAAVLADGPQRRVAVAASIGEDDTEAVELATWLDAAAPRSRANRAAAGPAPVSIARRADTGSRGGARPPRTEISYVCLPIPTAGGVTLGFAFAGRAAPADVADRLPPILARHAAVALALVTDALATERELAGLRAADTHRAGFVSTVAHELQTPLTGLSGYLDLILDGRVADAHVQREFLERGRTIVGSMTALVGDLLEHSKLESGTLSLEIGPFSVADALGAVAAGLMPIALDRGVRLEIGAPPRMRTATGDRRRVEQILTNLAANALKFGASGGEVELTARFDGTLAIIAIRDQGPGIAQDDQPRIFERFYRMTEHVRVGGTGLGLPIARDLARAMSGELAVTSLPGTGSSFVLVLPGAAGTISPEAVTAAIRDALDVESDRLHAVAAHRAGSALSPRARSRSLVGGAGGRARQPVSLVR